ncbi:nicotinamide-nucleotide amidase [Saccharothrix tamanrassetensis]|uniref:Nicotinamide-nucleotide amidase n=1 Tax=Saccharothrix tamanrassetensis TaxID=1051531 RepID=A0A841CHM4_9PSEU|nr:nicotinamide-nucleotide amidohydrolase family protein [Saccharothrix tamanrassetensis]MBB5955688.1 nicotinamide-nucleotide amidase [Saccharothrix tamanrassetensis]
MTAADVVAALRARGETIATAESLTAGLVAAEITRIAGSSAVLRGGLVVYATDLKTSLAGVDAVLLAEHGAVHPEVARQLADGARTRCGATWGLGLTGVAGPGPQDGVAAGTVHIGLSGPSGSVVRSITVGGDRHEVRRSSVDTALDLLLTHLEIADG